MNTNENIIEKAITLTDSLAELNFLLERLELLSDDIWGRTFLGKNKRTQNDVISVKKFFHCNT